jgi:hypothetical protein
MSDYEKNIKCTRNKKSDKAKDKFNKNGKNSTKHVRMVEKLLEKTIHPVGRALS